MSRRDRERAAAHNARMAAKDRAAALNAQMAAKDRAAANGWAARMAARDAQAWAAHIRQCADGNDWPGCVVCERAIGADNPHGPHRPLWTAPEINPAPVRYRLRRSDTRRRPSTRKAQQ